ncbi:Hypothetical protein DEACI_0827 [Acididesulfobacillus acetoxydans]|uniref:Uncharacterized protein n=1 Tax=Acididesulfobacillus acetoxydans TaxID=1561005 RepID=A0A8S0Y207_9FIRM|nr:Hypothetical protein DEACI_0827 [Acididesulfobacillus acetoxydans]CEJ09553.1 Hypothetical protein DEACI_4038 [Acididesulfobacillus acetoxydans]
MPGRKRAGGDRALLAGKILRVMQTLRLLGTDNTMRRQRRQARPLRALLRHTADKAVRGQPPAIPGAVGIPCV